MKTQDQNTATLSGEQKPISITRTMNLPIEQVWKAWTDAESFKKWWGPKEYSCPTAKLDVKVGGNYLASMKGPDGKEIWSTGTYKEVVPQKKIVLTDNFADSSGNRVPASYYNMPGEWPDEEIVITVMLQDAGGKTNMTMQQTNIPETMHNDCVDGWQQCFDKMEENLK